MTVDVREIECSDWVMRKLNSVHRCTVDEVLEAVSNYTAASWDHDPDRGVRLLVTGHTESGRKLRVVLYPIDIDAGRFRLGTAF